MLQLILPDRNHIRLIEKDIRRHQDRIGEETGVHVVRMFGGLVLKLRHAAQLAHIGKAVKNPGKLRMGGNGRLKIETVLFRIDSGRDIECQKGAGSLAELRRVLTYCQGMQIHNSVIALIFVRKADPVLQSAQIIAERQIPCRLHTAV